MGVVKLCLWCFPILTQSPLPLAALVVSTMSFCFHSATFPYKSPTEQGYPPKIEKVPNADHFGTRKNRLSTKCRLHTFRYEICKAHKKFERHPMPPSIYNPSPAQKQNIIIPGLNLPSKCRPTKKSFRFTFYHTPYRLSLN